MTKLLTEVFIDEIKFEPHRQTFPAIRKIYNRIDEIGSFNLMDMSDYKISNNNFLDTLSFYPKNSQNIHGENH